MTIEQELDAWSEAAEQGKLSVMDSNKAILLALKQLDEIRRNVRFMESSLSEISAQQNKLLEALEHRSHEEDQT